MSDHADELRRIFAGLKQFEHLDLIAAGADTANSLNSFINRLGSLGYDVGEFQITENDYKIVGNRPTLKYGVLQRKYGALMHYFELREKPVIVDTSLPRKHIL